MWLKGFATSRAAARGKSQSRLDLGLNHLGLPDLSSAAVELRRKKKSSSPSPCQLSPQATSSSHKNT